MTRPTRSHSRLYLSRREISGLISQALGRDAARTYWTSSRFVARPRRGPRLRATQDSGER